MSIRSRQSVEPLLKPAGGGNPNLLTGSRGGPGATKLSSPGFLQATPGNVPRVLAGQFLREVGLGRYSAQLVNAGYLTLEKLCAVDDQRLRELGVSPFGAMKLRRALVEAQNPQGDEVSGAQEVYIFLEYIGLGQYADSLLKSGFDEMETLFEIEDADLREMDFLRGHAVKLRKRLREFQGELTTEGTEVREVLTAAPPSALERPPQTLAAPVSATGLLPKVAPSPLLLKMVDDLSYDGCYGIEWGWDGSLCTYKSHYNPLWRIQGALQKGADGLFTTRSMSFTFQRGQGFVGGAFDRQELLFAQDLRAAIPYDAKTKAWTALKLSFLRGHLANEFGICSAVFIPFAEGVFEVGSTSLVQSAQDFFTEEANSAIADAASGEEILGAFARLAWLSR